MRFCNGNFDFDTPLIRYNYAVKIALAQINPIVGDIDGNRRKILAFGRRAEARGADLVVFPELALTGYPPRDLLELKAFVQKNLTALQDLAKATRRVGYLVGYVEPNPKATQKPCFNAAALLVNGRIVAKRFKTLLPTYDVFDESRHFESAPETSPIPYRGKRLGVHICEDMWHVPALWPESPYRIDPIARLAKAKADVFINLSSSPFHRGKTHKRLELVQHHVARYHRPFLFVNQVGGNDELIFDGNSFAVDGQGKVLGQASSFTEDLTIVDTGAKGTTEFWREEPEIAQIHDALVLGLRDYARKCGFEKVLLGLSGGIDSSVTAAIAVEALGAKNVLGVLMPSLYSSKGSVTDSVDLAKALGIRTHTLPITPVFRNYLKTLKPAFERLPPDLAEENLQARIRGTLLMALSNKLGMLLLTTGNKSEVSMGYCTLYGDMNGGLAVISDVFKTTVYDLAREINRRHNVIPENSITKAPSAELRPNQKDQDSLPPYEVLDPIVEAYVEAGKDVEDITAMGYAKPLVEKILRTIDAAEYKRRQAAPGLRLTSKAFGMGRRMPIARGKFR